MIVKEFESENKIKLVIDDEAERNTELACVDARRCGSEVHSHGVSLSASQG